MGPLTYTSTYTEPEAMQLIAHLQEYLKNKVLSVELKNWFHLRPHRVFSPCYPWQKQYDQLHLTNLCMKDIMMIIALQYIIL